MTKEETELWKSNPDKAIREVGFPMEENCMSEEKKCPKCLGEGYIPGAYLEGATECDCQKPAPAKEEWRVGQTVKYSENEYGTAIKRPNRFGATAWGLTEQEALQTAERIVEDHNNPLNGLVRTGELHTELEKQDVELKELTQERDQLKAEMDKWKDKARCISTPQGILHEENVSLRAELAKAQEEITEWKKRARCISTPQAILRDENIALQSDLTRANDEVKRLREESDKFQKLEMMRSVRVAESIRTGICHVCHQEKKC